MNIIRRAKEDNPELSVGFINNAPMSEAEMQFYKKFAEREVKKLEDGFRKFMLKYKDIL